MEMSAEHVSDHRVRRLTRRRDHQDVPRLDEFQCMQHRAEIRRVAMGGDGQAEEGGLQAGRAQLLDCRIDLAVSSGICSYARFAKG
jgi:hypothetical protein